MHGFAGGVCSGAAWMPDRVRHDREVVIAGLTRNPCTDDQRISGAPWIAGQARNDSRGSVVAFDAAHVTSKAACGWTAPRNQGTSPGLFVLAAPQDVRGAEGGSHPALVI